MPMLPIPAFVAAVLGYLALRTALSGGRLLLVMYLCVGALQSLFVALVGGYSVDLLQPVFPASASIIPPLEWITFRDALIERATVRSTIIHLESPAFTFFCRVLRRRQSMQLSL